MNKVRQSTETTRISEYCAQRWFLERSQCRLSLWPTDSDHVGRDYLFTKTTLVATDNLKRQSGKKEKKRNGMKEEYKEERREQWKYSDTSANEDNSFLNHIR